MENNDDLTCFTHNDTTDIVQEAPLLIDYMSNVTQLGHAYVLRAS